MQAFSNKTVSWGELCPQTPKDVGGVPRDPIFQTVAQAWACLDQNADTSLTFDELGPGAETTVVSWGVFVEHIRKNRDMMLQGLPAQAYEVKKWTELILQHVPDDFASPITGAPTVAAGAQVKGATYGGPVPGKGQVAAVYTFGAPGISKSGMLRNNAREDGCFPGLRTFARGSQRIDEYQILLEVSDPIAWILNELGFHHARSDVLSLDEDSALNAGYSMCADGWNGPHSDRFFWFQGHTEATYSRKLAELDKLLLSSGWHEPVLESDVTDIQRTAFENEKRVGPQCSEHPSCAHHAAALGANLTCCPNQQGEFLDCCVEAVKSIERFYLDSPFGIGDYVRVTNNKTRVQRAFLQVVYIWHKEMDNMLGQVFPVIRIMSPGLVGLPSMDGSDGGVWYFPISTLEPVPPEVAAQYGPQPATPKVDPVVSQISVLQAQDTNPLGQKDVRGTDHQNERRLSDAMSSNRQEQITKAKVFHELASTANVKQDMNENMDAEDYGFELVSHVMAPWNNTGLSAQMSLFQDAEQDCVMSFAARSPNELPARTAFNSQPGFFEDKPAFAKALEVWHNMLAGYTPEFNQGVRLVAFSNMGSIGRPLTFAWQTPQMLRSKAAGGGCVVKTESGTRPCPVNRTEEDLLNGVTRIATTRDFCGIPGVQTYVAWELQRIVNSVRYKNNLAPHLPKCKSVTAVGHDVGGAFATLWAACVNSGLQPGQAGYDDYAAHTWDVVEPAIIPPYLQNATDPGIFKLQNKQIGKFLDLKGSLKAVELDRGELVLNDDGVDGLEQKWQFTPEGFIRSMVSQKCLGVTGELGSGVGRPLGTGQEAVLEDCQYGVISTNQAWNFSSDGFLVNQYTGLCLSAGLTLIHCPLSDQVWHLRSDGFIVNQLSGQCLDISGSPGTNNGAKAVIWPCEYDDPNTDQQWELTSFGFLWNRKSKKCLDVEGMNGVTNSAFLVLWDCVKSLAAASGQQWRLTHSGYIQHLKTGKCIDVKGVNQDEQNTPLVLSTCDAYHMLSTDALWELTKGGLIINRGRDIHYKSRCLTAKSDASGVIVESCDTNMRQMWMVTEDGRIRSSVGGRQCLEVHDSTLSIHTCQKLQENVAPEMQAWFLTPEGFLVNRDAMLCIDVASDNATVSAGVCTMTDQRWVMEQDGHIKNKLSGLCLDAQWPREVGAFVVIADCGDGQLWEAVDPDNLSNVTTEEQLVKPNLLRHNLSGRCLDVGGEMPVNEQNDARLVLNVCDPTKPAQKWGKTSGGFFKNSLSGKCADVLGPVGHSPGQAVVLFSCEDDLTYTDQTWQLVGDADAVKRVTEALKPQQGLQPWPKEEQDTAAP